MKDNKPMDIWLDGGLGGEKEHGSDEKHFFGMLYPLGITMEG